MNLELGGTKVVETIALKGQKTIAGGIAPGTVCSVPTTPLGGVASRQAPGMTPSGSHREMPDTGGDGPD